MSLVCGGVITTDGLPALYRSADDSSLVGQTRFLRVTQVRLVSLVVAAVGGGFRHVLGEIDVFGLIGFVGFLAAIGAEIYLLTSRPDRVWYEGRAAAESAKTLAWRYMVGGLPFPVSASGGAADQVFLERLKELLADLGDVELEPASESDSQITAEMRRVRALTLPERAETYRTARIQDQQHWYRAKARWNAERSRRWSLFVIGLEVLGVLAAALKAFDAVSFDALGLVAAAAAALTAWGQAKQYEILSRAYFVASQELATINSQVASRRTEEEWALFVQDAEEAISREHTLWRASRGIKLRSS